jgi:hypothetical protein
MPLPLPRPSQDRKPDRPKMVQSTSRANFSAPAQNRARTLSQLFPKPAPCPLTCFFAPPSWSETRGGGTRRRAAYIRQRCDWHDRTPLAITGGSTRGLSATDAWSYATVDDTVRLYRTNSESFSDDDGRSRRRMMGSAHTKPCPRRALAAVDVHLNRSGVSSFGSASLQQEHTQLLAGQGACLRPCMMPRACNRAVASSKIPAEPKRAEIREIAAARRQSTAKRPMRARARADQRWRTWLD